MDVLFDICFNFEVRVSEFLMKVRTSDASIEPLKLVYTTR